MKKIVSDDQRKAFDDAYRVFEQTAAALDKSDIRERLHDLKIAREALEAAATDIEATLRDYYDERSERWQDSDRGYAFDNLMDAYADIAFAGSASDLLDAFDEAINIPDRPGFEP